MSTYSCTGNPIWNLKFENPAGTGEYFDEKSMMISGMIPLLIKANGTPIWGNKDKNSPHAFRPVNYDMSVSKHSSEIISTLFT